MPSVYHPPMTEETFVAALRPRITPEFLATLCDAIQGDVCLVSDYMEIDRFIEVLHAFAGVPCPPLPSYTFVDQGA